MNFKRQYGLLFWLICGCFVAQTSAAQAPNCSDFSKVSWLTGEWHSTNDKRTTIEHWQLLDNQNMSGFGSTQTHTADKNNPVFKESLRIVKMSDEIYYLAKTPQNPIPVAFQLTQCSEKLLRFENKQHDFPQIIEYTKVGDLSLDVEVRDFAGKGFNLHFNKHQESVSADLIARVQAFVTAYNSSDLATMMTLTSQNVKWLNVAGSEVAIEAANQAVLKKSMQEYFSADAGTRSVLLNPQQQGDKVVAIEQAIWSNSAGIQKQCSPVIYQFANNLIENVWYFPASQCE